MSSMVRRDARGLCRTAGTVETKITETPRCLTPAGIAVYSIPVDRIGIPEGVQRACSPESIAALASSIHKYGVIHPLTVRTSHGGRYELVCGIRRLRAVKLLGHNTVRCIVINTDSMRSEAMRLCENVQTEPPHFLDIAAAIARLCTSYGYSMEGAAVRLCVSERYVRDKLRLLEFSSDQRQRIRAAKLSEGQCMSLLSVADTEAREELLCRVIKGVLDQRSTDELVYTYLKKRSKHQRQKQDTYLIRDIRIFYNTIERALDIMRNAGYPITAEKSRSEEGEVISIVIGDVDDDRKGK